MGITTDMKFQFYFPLMLDDDDDDDETRVFWFGVEGVSCLPLNLLILFLLFVWVD